MKVKMRVLGGVVLMLAMAACGGGERPADGAKRSGKPGAERAKKDGKTTDAVPVQLVALQRRDIRAYMLFSSNVDSEKVVSVYPLAAGIVDRILADEGQRVTKGQELARLDDREMVIREARSKVNYEQAKQELARQKLIFEQEMVSQDEYDKLILKVEQARLDWEQDKLMLSYTRITSPISGVVSKRLIKAGNKVGTTDHAFTVISPEDKIVVVNAPEQEMGAVHLGQEGEVTVGDKSLSARVIRKSPAVDPESGTFKITLGLDDPQGFLAVGQFVNVRVVRDVHTQALLVSKDALIFEGGKAYVFVVDQDKVRRSEIRSGYEDGGWMEVLEGLSDSDRVVTAGKSALKDGSQIRVVEDEKPQKKPVRKARES